MIFISEENKPCATLTASKMIDFIVVETDRDTQGDFEEDMLRNQLEVANDHEVRQMADNYGWL
jgi:hypothetical protein